MSDIEEFPRLDFEAPTTFQSVIEEMFAKIKHLHLAWKAKQILYCGLGEERDCENKNRIRNPI